ncbi:hypothetical protein [Dictyobacter arantiisoli]|nr:hypothetical protein [Dictyobacter arantiisoli]
MDNSKISSAYNAVPTMSDAQTAQPPSKEMQPDFPVWPTSLPGPMRKQPPTKMRSINSVRSEQLTEIGYNQETGEPAEADPHRYQPEHALKDRTSFDQPAISSEQEA